MFYLHSVEKQKQIHLLPDPYLEGSGLAFSGPMVNVELLICL